MPSALPPLSSSSHTQEASSSKGGEDQEEWPPPFVMNPKKDPPDFKKTLADLLHEVAGHTTATVAISTSTLSKLRRAVLSQGSKSPNELCLFAYAVTCLTAFEELLKEPNRVKKEHDLERLKGRIVEFASSIPKSGLSFRARHELDHMVSMRYHIIAEIMSSPHGARPVRVDRLV